MQSMAECIFCKIIAKEIPSQMVYEDDQVLAFNDIAPQAPVHIVVIPKEHVSSLIEIKNYNSFGHFFEKINKIAVQKGIDKTGFRVVVNQGKDAGQAVAHLHFHLLGGRILSWPPG